MTNDKKLGVLKTALSARQQEVEDYQFNIDNFRRAIQMISERYYDNQDLQEFRAALIGRHEEECKQQLRAIVLRDVLAEQITELES